MHAGADVVAFTPYEFQGHAAVLPDDQVIELGIANLIEQARRISDALGESARLDTDYAVTLMRRNSPEWVEQCFVVMPWNALGESYTEALEAVFSMLECARGGAFRNLRVGETGPGRLRPLRCVRRLDAYLQSQKKRYVPIIRAQLGARYRGISVSQARGNLEMGEVGLGAVTVGLMLLGSPHRLVCEDDLYIDCPGDLVRPQAGCGRVTFAPFYMWRDRQLTFAASRVDAPFTFSGSASGCVR